MKCPFCLGTHQRVLGGIILMTPGMINDPGKAPVAGRCCNECMSLIAQMLDKWMNGGINNFKAKLIEHNLVRN